MSRSISASYKDAQGREFHLDVGTNELLGTQDSSKAFWRLPIHKRLGVERLADLGFTDPIWFRGWDDISLLEREVSTLEQNIDSIPFHDQLKERWIQNLRRCLNMLKQSAPPDSVPEFMIG